MKKCTICLKEKKFDEFGILSRSIDGHYPQCKDCKSDIDKSYYKRKREVILNKVKSYYSENKVQILTTRNKDRVANYNKLYKKEKSDYISKYNKEYRELNKEEINEKRKEYRANNREKINEYSRNRLKNNKSARLAKRLRGRLNDFLKNKNFTKTLGFQEYIGCSQADLVKHIESLFQPGMTWDNYNYETWHIDHREPLSSANDEEEMYGLCHYSNLQPMWAKENIKKNNKSNTCWQKIQRDKLIKEDEINGFRFDLKASEFELAYEHITDEHRKFIERYEWLGSVGFGVRYVFTARHEMKLAGVVMIAEPNSYQFGIELEALIQRGACSSWAPKNLNSRLVMFACKWMVDNTKKRIFVAYSDPEAGEIGTIYQACNFDYLGQNFGSGQMYRLSNGKEKGDRHFTRTSSMKKWAKELNIKWMPEWSKSNGFQDPKVIPKDIRVKLKLKAKEERNKCEIIKKPKKGKYVLLLKKHKKEKLEKTWIPQPYPKRK